MCLPFCRWGQRGLGVAFACLLLFTLGFIYYVNESLLRVSPQAGNRLIRQYPACPIPQLEPFHESVQVHIDNLYIPGWFNCKEYYPLFFSSTLQSTIIPAQEPDYYRVWEGQKAESCCYKTVVREGSAGGDNEMVSPQCFPVSLTTETKIPDGHEFIAIFCKREGQNETLVDVHSFVHLKPSSTWSNNEEMEGKFNVVIFGMGGISRMNFLRNMPESYSFLKNELEAVEMFGYNKVGGMPGDFNCDFRFDDCPLIWKEYSKQGYYTMFAEDDSDTLFHDLGLRFERKPTDYYLGPFSHLADPNFKTKTCYGPRLTFQVLLEYMEKYVDTMSRNKKNFFGFSWSTPLTHDYLHASRHGEPHLLKSLQWLKESGHLKNTIFILMSDHGVRLDDIRNTIQGQLEERLPLLYFVLPESFKIKYSRAHKNLLYNADKLVTTYDLHQTLKEILNLDMIENRKLLEREDDLFRLGRNMSQGISLFLPIPEFRTCKMAGIDMNFCSCTYMEVANVSDPEIDAVGKAKLAVSHINSLIEVNIAEITDTTSPYCATLELDKVNMVRRVGYANDSSWYGYTINLETKPGGGQFEALVSRESDDDGGWNVRGPIVRSNHGNQSHCVRNIFQLKPYCYCLN